MKGQLLQVLPSGHPSAAAWLEKSWNLEQHQPVLNGFLLGNEHPSPRQVVRLFAHASPEESLVLSEDLPPASARAVYFVRRNSVHITPSNVEGQVHWGVLEGRGVLHSLLQLVGSLQGAPAQTVNWSQNAQKEYKGQLQACLADLTEAVHLAEGRTRLFIPTDALDNLTAALQDKDLVQRMESILLHWTRQVKHVVSQQDVGHLSHGGGLLAEIKFWHSRGEDLANILAQLDLPGVTCVVELLQRSKSCYLPAFLALRERLNKEASTARDNTQFLAVLKEPCTALETAAPKEVANMLPHIMGRLRLIWSLSPFWGVPERITSLLRRFSSQIIAIRTQAICVSDALTGDVDPVIQTLQESIEAAAAWKGAYAKTARSIAAATPGHCWDALEPSAIFAQLDSFTQRCRDLMSICLDRKQFGADATLPVFGGATGADTRKALQQIQVGFAKAAHKLVALTYSPLDVEESGWTKDFGEYSAALGDLEQRFAATASAAIEKAGCLQARMECIMALNSMAKRAPLKTAMQAHERALFHALEAENAAVARAFDQIHKGPLRNSRGGAPQFSGAAAAATCLIRRSTTTWAAMQGYLPELLETQEGTAAAQAHAALQTSLQAFVSTTHAEWFHSVQPDVVERLKKPLLKQDKTAGGTLSVNMDAVIEEVLSEALGWERLRLSLPFPAAEVAKQRERLRKARIHAADVARAYNQVIERLHRDERRLFHDRLRQLDRKVLAGVSKISWGATKSTLDAYCTEALRQCKDTAGTVAEWRAGQARISASCSAMSETLLLAMEGKRVYSEGAFVQAQADHMAQAQQTLEMHHGDITSAVSALHHYFAADSAEVLREWRRCTEKVDNRVEDALKTAMRRSLARLAKILIGDKKAEVAPLFTVQLSLEKSGRVELRPDVQEVFAMVERLIGRAVDVTACLHHIAEPPADAATEKLAEENASDTLPQAKPSFCEAVRGDRDGAPRTVQALSQSMPSVVDRVQTLLLYWEKKYKQLWDQDKDAFMRRYEKAQKPLAAFEADIRRHRDIIDDITSESASEAIRFLHVDCGPLKQALVSHCEAWLSKFTTLLANLAMREVAELQKYVTSSSAELTQLLISSNTDQAETLELGKTIIDEREGMQAKIEQLHGRFQLLEEAEVPMGGPETTQLEALQLSWEACLKLQLELHSKLGDSRTASEELGLSLQQLNREHAEP
ncbi:g1149 [Coccomyxa elongata]